MNSKRKQIKNGELNQVILSENYFEFMIEHTKDAIWILDKDLKTIRYSKKVAKITEYNYYEFNEKSFRNIVDEKSINEILNIVSDHGYLNLKEYKIEGIRLRTSKGDCIYTDAIVKILPISESECNLIIHLDTSPSIYNNRDAVLKELNRNHEANRFKSIMLSLISHEFRTPLTSIIGFSDILMKSCQSQEEHEMLSYVLESSRRLNATLNSISTLAAIESEQLIVKKELVDLRDLMFNLKLNFESVAQSKGLELNFEYERNLKPVYSDEECIRQILYYLIDNAIKFTNSGGVSVEANTISNKFEDILELKITDTGIGINKEKLFTIFEPFRQGSEGINRDFDGLGIGLTITEKLVKKLDSVITVDSKLGEGSVFTIHIPSRTA
ncbi:MAG: HAMP domain-containing histidine kinase [Candidatus Kapabacteria bacterium]|nr:HAMP domain-containing histidine kinase [Candidatus Kapabacteria bacterium]